MDREATIKRALAYLPADFGKEPGTYSIALVSSIVSAVLEEVEADRATDAALFEDIKGAPIKVDVKFDAEAVAKALWDTPVQQPDANGDVYPPTVMKKAVDSYLKAYQYLVTIDGVNIYPQSLDIDWGDVGPTHHYYYDQSLGQRPNLGRIRMRVALQAVDCELMRRFRDREMFDMGIDYHGSQGKIVRQIHVPSCYIQKCESRMDSTKDSFVVVDFEIVPTMKMQWVDV